jgi:hypothetical protein
VAEAVDRIALDFPEHVDIDRARHAGAACGGVDLVEFVILRACPRGPARRAQ